MCGVSVCPVHTRTTVVDDVEPNVPARAITYVGDYAVATLDNPEFGSPSELLGLLFGEAPKLTDMFMHLVVKVGPTGSLGDVMDAGQLEKSTVFRETFLGPDDARLRAAIDQDGPLGNSAKFDETLSTIFRESHELVLESVKNGIVS